MNCDAYQRLPRGSSLQPAAPLRCGRCGQEINVLSKARNFLVFQGVRTSEIHDRFSMVFFGQWVVGSG